LSLGGDGFGADLFGPLRFPVVRAPAPGRPGWLDATLALLHERAPTLAALVLEPLVQGAAGMQLVEPEAVAALAGACRETGVLLVLDEVATGFGRTGTLFAAEACGVRPDLLCLGKSITGGYLPMSATVASRAVFDAFRGADLGPRTLYHGHSYGGNALAAAVALRHLRLLLETGVLDNVRIRSAELDTLLAKRLGGLDAVADIRLCGLMGGVELAPLATGRSVSDGPDLPGRTGRRVCAAAVSRGVFLRPLGDVVVIMPPLTVTAAEIERIVDVLEASIAEVYRR
jgi:adenosylmethionine-8-amino-7-oxononanoate aminotransferase